VVLGVGFRTPLEWLERPANLGSMDRVHADRYRRHRHRLRRGWHHSFAYLRKPRTAALFKGLAQPISIIGHIMADEYFRAPKPKLLAMAVFRTGEKLALPPHPIRRVRGLAFAHGNWDQSDGARPA
jgi:hypothetical protein